MATTPKVYVICDQNCKFEGMTKEQIYTAILQAVNEGTIGDIDAGFVTTIKTINGLPLKFFVGEQAAYDELTPEDKKDLFAIITNDTTKEGIINALSNLNKIKKQIDEGKFHANGIFTKEIASLAELDSLVANNPYGSFGIRIAKDININGKGTLPKWGYGYLVIANKDAALNLVGLGGVHITAYYNNNPEMRGWTIRNIVQAAETAIKLSDGWTDNGTWFTGDKKTLYWEDWRGMYAVKLVDTNDNRIYSFIINADSNGGSGVMRSNSVVFSRRITATEEEISLAWLECEFIDIAQLSFKRMRIIDTDNLAGGTTFKVYWKKIF